MPHEPRKDDRFTFSLRNIGHTGRDPIGGDTRPPLNPLRAVAKLSEIGAYGLHLSDNDLVPIDATPAERDRIVRDFKKALADHGMKVPAFAANLASDPAFKDGAFTSTSQKVRACALQKSMRAMDLGAELGAKTFLLRGGREGCEVGASRSPAEAIRRLRGAIDFLCGYSIDQRHDYRFALEATSSGSGGDLYLASTGCCLGFIETLEHPELAGVGPGPSREEVGSLRFTHEVAQALEAGKLFHVILNDRKPGRFDQDFRFGSEDLKGAFHLVKLLEDVRWDGMRHFDARAYRSEDADGVWDFAAGCMRTYLILREKVARFAEDRAIQELLAEACEADGGLAALTASYSRSNARALAEAALDRRALASRRLRRERLDQLVIDLLLGVR